MYEKNISIEVLFSPQNYPHKANITLNQQCKHSVPLVATFSIQTNNYSTEPAARILT